MRNLLYCISFFLFFTSFVVAAKGKGDWRELIIKEREDCFDKIYIFKVEDENCKNKLLEEHKKEIENLEAEHNWDLRKVGCVYFGFGVGTFMTGTTIIIILLGLISRDQFF